MSQRKKMNKVIAGYHMLMLISYVDGDFSPEEGAEMVEYLSDSFPFTVNLDKELDILSTLKKEEYFGHFVNAMNDFYADSTQKERTSFLNAAVKMVMADRKLTVDENVFLTELYNAWDIDHLEG
jgi:uncharacterized tellurite resistance protein B-like protein